MSFDLHVHSRCSDGTDDPASLPGLARVAGLEGFALTDHDTVAGIPAAQSAADEAGVELVPGIELSSSHEGRTVHVLGHFLDPGSPALAAHIEAEQHRREGRAREIVASLAVDFPLAWEHVLAEAGDPRTVGRAHIADALVRLGIASDRPSAFSSLLHDGSPYVPEPSGGSVEAAIAVIRAAGGAAVIAHVWGDQRLTAGIGSERLEAWAQAGLAGIEVDHREHGRRERRELRRIAAELGLVVTGGSDYHGLGKPNLLGENRVLGEVVEQLRSAAEDAREYVA